MPQAYLVKQIRVSFNGPRVYQTRTNTGILNDT
jgi:hypothetical protein